MKKNIFKNITLSVLALLLFPLDGLGFATAHWKDAVAVPLCSYSYVVNSSTTKSCKAEKGKSCGVQKSLDSYLEVSFNDYCYVQKITEYYDNWEKGYLQYEVLEFPTKIEPMQSKTWSEVGAKGTIKVHFNTTKAIYNGYIYDYMQGDYTNENGGGAWITLQQYNKRYKSKIYYIEDGGVKKSGIFSSSSAFDNSLGTAFATPSGSDGTRKGYMTKISEQNRLKPVYATYSGKTNVLRMDMLSFDKTKYYSFVAYTTANYNYKYTPLEHVYYSGGVATPICSTETTEITSGSLAGKCKLNTLPSIPSTCSYNYTDDTVDCSPLNCATAYPDYPTYGNNGVCYGNTALYCKTLLSGGTNFGLDGNTHDNATMETCYQDNATCEDATFGLDKTQDRCERLDLSCDATHNIYGEGSLPTDNDGTNIIFGRMTSSFANADAMDDVMNTISSDIVSGDKIFDHANDGSMCVGQTSSSINF